MNIEELEQIKQDIKAVYNVMYNFDDRLCDDMQERVKRIETLLTAYEKKCKELKKEIQDDLDVRNRWGLTLQELEKEKGENVKLRLQDIPLIEGELQAYKDRVNELKQELEKEKEKNKELIKERATEIVYVDRNFIRKDKIKPIQIIDLDGKIHNVYKIEEE